MSTKEDQGGSEIVGTDCKKPGPCCPKIVSERQTNLPISGTIPREQEESHWNEEITDFHRREGI